MSKDSGTAQTSSCTPYNRRCHRMDPPPTHTTPSHRACPGQRVPQVYSPAPDVKAERRHQSPGARDKGPPSTIKAGVTVLAATRMGRHNTSHKPGPQAHRQAHTQAYTHALSVAVVCVSLSLSLALHQRLLLGQTCAQRNLDIRQPRRPRAHTFSRACTSTSFQFRYARRYLCFCCS